MIILMFNKYKYKLRKMKMLMYNQIRKNISSELFNSPFAYTHLKGEGVSN